MFTKSSACAVKRTSRKVTPQSRHKSNTCTSSSLISTEKMDGKPSEEASKNIISLLDEEEERQIAEAKKRSIHDIFSGSSAGKKKPKSEPEIISILSDDDDDTDDGGGKISRCSSTGTIDLLDSTSGGDESDDRDEDVMIVDASKEMRPAFQTTSIATMSMNDDIMEVGTKNAMDLPHMRQHCTKIRFIEDNTRSIGITDNSKFCDKCYCYVCDVPAGDCDEWSKHCHASDKGKNAMAWKRLRENKKIPTANLQPTSAHTFLYTSLDRLQNRLFSLHEESSSSIFTWKSLYKPDEITNTQAYTGLVQCRKCKWWTKWNNRSSSREMIIEEWCRACGRVASDKFFNKRQRIPYIAKAGDISLGTKKIPFHIKARDPRQIEPYKEKWQQYEGEDGWTYSEEEMKNDFFKHRIGTNPQIQSLLFCMPVLEESKIPNKAKVTYESNSINSREVSALETEALIIGDRNDRAIIQELREYERTSRHSIFLSAITTEYNDETQTGNISITLTLSPQSFHVLRTKDYSCAQLLGAWYSVFPFKLSELTVGLPASHNKTTQENEIFLGKSTGLIPSKLTPSQKNKMMKELGEDKNQALIKYKKEAAAIASSLSFTSSSGEQRNGGISDNDASFKGTLRRYFRETLPDDYSYVVHDNDCGFGNSPAGRAMGIVSNHRSMLGFDNMLSSFDLRPTYGLRSYLSTEDLDICHRYLDVELQARKRDGIGINGLMIQLENLHHEPVDHIEGFSETLQLLDFQRQAVAWAYEREQVEGGIQSYLWTKLPSTFHHITTIKTVPIDVYFSPILDKFSMEKPSIVRGGVIAEQMGLGKTVISLALILKNPAPATFSGTVERNPNAEVQTHDNNVSQTASVQQLITTCNHDNAEQKTQINATPNVVVLPQINVNRAKYMSKGTLVVCNVSLVGQWIDEAKSKLKDPGLVYSYHGSNRKRRPEILAQNSIVVTTYATLASDDTFWRSKSSDPNYCPPCEQIKWWRIICDESHALKSQNTTQYRALSNIQAVNKWCVTGTPMNTTITDLKGQLSFLGLQDISGIFGKLTEYMPSHSNSSQKRSYRNDYAGRCLFLLRNIMIRHSIQMTSRSEARSLMSLPPKEEKIINISFTDKEREEYDKLEEKAKAVYLQIKSSDPSLISKNFLKISSALLPLRVACSGGQVEEGDSNGKSSLSTVPMDIERSADDMECPICLDQIENARATRCKPIAHLFCKVCIEEYFDCSNTVDCPSCRASIKIKELQPVNITEASTSDTIATKNEDETKPSEDNTKKPKKKVIIDDIIFKSKFERLLTELKQIRDNEPESKTLVFSQFFSTLQWMKQELPKHGFQFRTLSGDMAMTQRAKALRDFQKDPPTTIFLLSMRSGAVGINLTQANRVFLMEPAVNPALEAQAVGRVYRLGQRKSVQVIRMRVEDTIESRMADVLEKKYGASKKPAPEESEESADSPTTSTSITHEGKESTVSIPAVGHLTTDKAPSLLVDEFDALFGV